MKVDLSKLNHELLEYGNCWIHADLKHSSITVYAEDAKDVNKIEEICKKYFEHVKVINTPKPTEPELDLTKELKSIKEQLASLEAKIDTLTKKIGVTQIENERLPTPNTTK